jgi:outer membrane lipoprotein SlyB
VESVRQVELEGQGTGLGAVAGGVAGGLLGNQFGSGKGKTAMTVLGAVGGGLAGNQVEKKARSETVYRVSIRMQDGSVGTFQQSQSFAVGTKVVVDGQTLRMASDGVGR